MPCGQHQAGLILAPLTAGLDVLCPLFCTAKLIDNGTRMGRIAAAVRADLDQHLVRVADGSLPQQQHRTYAASVLETCYFQRNLVAQSLDSADVNRLKAEDRCRRKRGQRLMAMLSGDWMSWPPVHHCNGCCASREEAVVAATDAYLAIILRRLPVPALNKWGSIFPLVGWMLLGFLAHRLFARAWQLTTGNDSDEEAVPEGQDAVQGPTMSSYRRDARKREQKALDFWRNEQSLQRLMIWQSLGSHLV